MKNQFLLTAHEAGVSNVIGQKPFASFALFAAYKKLCVHCTSVANHLKDHAAKMFIAVGDKAFASFALFAAYKKLCVHCASVANYFNDPVISSLITLRFIRTTNVGAASAANDN